MALIVNRSIFAAALRDVLPATVGRTVMPILSNVLLTNDGKDLTIVGTNLEYAISITLPCNECDLPDVVVDARLLQSWLTNQTSEFVALNAKDDYVTLQADKSKTKVKVLSAEEFPKIETLNNVLLKLDPFDLANALAQTVHGVSQAQTEVRQYTRGIYLQFANHVVKLTAMNGIYMIHRQMNTNYGTNVNVGVIPQRCILPLVKLLTNAEDDAEITFEAGKTLVLTFKAKPYSKVYFKTQLIETNYPAYEKFATLAYDLCIVLPKEDFVRALNNCMLFASDDANRVHYEIDEFGIYLRAQAPQRGEHEDYLPALSLTGRLDNEFMLNGKFILDWLRTVNTDNVQMECRNSANKLILFRDADAPEKGYGVFPPMILKDE